MSNRADTSQGPADSPAPQGSATARAPGVCGVLAQGVLGDMPFSVTCPVDFYSRVRVDLSGDGPGVEAPQDCEKTVAAVRRTLAHLRRAKMRAEVHVSSPIPRGRGLGSSTADLAGSHRRHRSGAGRGTQSLRHRPDCPLHRAHRRSDDAGPRPFRSSRRHGSGEPRRPPPMEIVALDFGGSSGSSLDDRTRRWKAVDHRTDESLALIRRGIAEKSPALVGQGATVAAEAGSQIESRPRLEELVSFAREVGAVGVNGGLGQGVSGVLLDATQRRGKSTYIKARQAFPDAETIYHFRMLGGGVQVVT